MYDYKLKSYMVGEIRVNALITLIDNESLSVKVSAYGQTIFADSGFADSGSSGTSGVHIQPNCRIGLFFNNSEYTTFGLMVYDNIRDMMDNAIATDDIMGIAMEHMDNIFKSRNNKKEK